jgi:hypothetical protein
MENIKVKHTVAIDIDDIALFKKIAKHNGKHTGTKPNTQNAVDVACQIAKQSIYSLDSEEFEKITKLKK